MQVRSIKGLLAEEVTPQSGRTGVHSTDSKIATTAETSNTSISPIISDNVGEPEKIYLKSLINDRGVSTNLSKFR